VAAEPAESPRDRKRQRDESEPAEDDEPGKCMLIIRRRGALPK
jgi:bromodomain-containing protein 8